MPTPIFNFRLQPDKADQLREIARIYGAKSTSHFLRDMIEAAISGDPAAFTVFQARLIRQIGEQLVIQFPPPGTERTERKARKVSKARKARTQRKGITQRKARSQRRKGRVHDRTP